MEIINKQEDKLIQAIHTMETINKQENNEEIKTDVDT